MKRAYKTTYRTTYKTAHLGSKLKAFAAITAWHNKIIAEEPSVLLVQGDSTGNDGDDWVNQTLQILKTKYPSHTIVNKLWNHAKQAYDPRRILGSTNRVSIGSSGDAYAVFPGGNLNYVKVDYSDNHQIAGDIDIRVKFSTSDLTPSTDMVFCGRWGSADPHRIFNLGINTAGYLFLQWSTDGTLSNGKTILSTVPIIDKINPDTGRWVRATLDVDNGDGGYDVNFYVDNISTPELSFVKLGDTVTGTGATSIHTGNTTKFIEIGSEYNGYSRIFVGKIYEAHVLNGIDGVPVITPDFDLAFPAGITSFKDTEGNIIRPMGTVTVGNGSPGLMVLNASHPGAAIAYSKDAIRFDLQASLEPDLAFINYSHNEGADIDYKPDYQGLIDMILAKYVNAGIICTAQNPEINATYEDEHAIRCQQIIELANTNEYMLVDVFNKFLSYGDFSHLMVDSYHTNLEGSRVWRDLVLKLLNRY